MLQQSLLDFAETSTSGTITSPWGTWEDLLLASAVLKHGTNNWSTISEELQSRVVLFNLSPSLFSAEACKCRFLTLNGRFSSCVSSSRDEHLEIHSIPWFEELRKLRVAQLKIELEHYDGSIGSLQRKLKRLKAERAQSGLVNKPAGKLAAPNDSSDHHDLKRSSEDAVQAEKLLEAPSPGERVSSQTSVQVLLRESGTGDSEQARSDAGSEQGGLQANVASPGCEDIYTDNALPNDSREPPPSRDRCSTDVKAADLQQSSTERSDSVLDPGQIEEADTVDIDLLSVGQLDHVSSAQIDRTESEDPQIVLVPESEEFCQAMDIDKGEGLQEAELATTVESSETQAKEERKSVTERVEDDVECGAKLRQAEPMDIDDCYGNMGTESPPAEELSMEASSIGCKEEEEKLSCASGVREDALLIQSSCSGANAMDLLRLAYGSVQDATPVSTPEASNATEPPVEPSTMTSSPDNLPAATDLEDLRASAALEKNSDGEFLTSNEEILALKVQEDSLLDTPTPNDYLCMEQTLPVDSSLAKSPLQKLNNYADNPPSSLNNQLVGHDSPSSSHLPSSILTSQLETETLDVPSVQIPQPQFLASVISDHHHSEENPGLVLENQLIPQQEVHDSIKKAVEMADKEVTESNDAETRSSNMDMESLRSPGRESGSLEEHPKADETGVIPGAMDSGGKSLADAGLSIPSVDIKPKLLTEVSEEDSLLLHVMKLKGTNLSSLWKSQNTNCHNDSIVEEGKESSSEATDPGKQVKLDNVTEGITSRSEEGSGTDPHGIAMTEGSLLLKVRQFKSRSGRLKVSMKQPEQILPATVESTSRMLDLSGVGRRDASAIEVFSTRRSRLKLSKNRCPGEDQAKEKEVQAVQSAPKAKEDDFEMQDCKDEKDSQPERSEVSSPPDEAIDKSPMSKRIKTQTKLLPKMLPLLECLRSINAHRFAPLFKQRQESQDNDRYKCLIKRHMDLNTVGSLLEEGMYSGIPEFFRDLLLVFNNALVFYSRDSQEFGAARILRECVMKEMERLLQTEAPQKVAIRPTRKREFKKLGEVVNFISAPPASEGKRRVTLRSSSIDHVVYESNVDGELGSGGAELGLGPQSSLISDTEVENSSQVKELEMERKEQHAKNFSKGSTRSKKAKVQVNVDDKIDQLPAKKHKDKEKNAKRPEDMGTKHPVKNDLVSSHGLKKSSQNFVKSKETSSKEPGISRKAKYLSARHATVHQEEARNSLGGRGSRNTQSTPPVTNSVTRGNQSSIQVLKRGRS